MKSCRTIIVFLTVLQIIDSQADSKDSIPVLPINSNVTKKIEEIKPDPFKSILDQSVGNVTDDELEQRNNPGWIHKKAIKGYEIMSNEIKFKTKILKKKKVVKIEIATGSARSVELITSRRDIEIKISTWNKMDKVRIKVPFGYQPEELRILEKPRKIVVFAPFDFIEFQDVTVASNSTHLAI